MRFLVVLCVIAALAAPSLGQSSSSAEPASPSTEANRPEPETQNADERVNADATPASEPAEIPSNEAESNNDNNQAHKIPPYIAEPQIDPTPAPGQEPVVVEVTTPESRPFSNFLHSIYDRFPFHLPDFHLPSLWPFRGLPPRGRFPSRDRNPEIFIIRESEPEYY